MDFFFSKLMRQIETLERALNNMERRQNEMFREGEILEVHPDGTYTAKFYGDESKSKKFPHPQQAGEISDWVPYSVGQRVMLLNPTGEAGKGFIIPGGYTETFDQPSNAPGTAVRKVGASIDTTTDGTRTIISGTVVIEGDVHIRGGTLTHEGIYIGSGHVHTEVVPGGGLSGPPPG